MLLRSSSAPVLNSWVPQYSRESSPDPEFQLHHRTRSVCLSNSIDDHTRKLTSQAVSELNVHSETSKPKKSKKTVIPPHPVNNKQLRKDDNTGKPDAKASLAPAPAPSSRSAVERLFLSSGLGEEVVNGDEGSDLQTHMVSKKTCNGGESDGGGGSGGSGSGAGFSETNSDGSDRTDAYYQKMIKANPGNALLLGNYAKYLKEVRGNLDKAQEYCERAISANLNDGNILSLYADIIWQNQSDSQRAENYFKQAIKTSPNDCYVLASYARFLWDVEEVEDNEVDEGEEEKRPHEIDHGGLLPNIFYGASHKPSITAAL